MLSARSSGFLNVPANPTEYGSAGLAAYRQSGCGGIVAVGSCSPSISRKALRYSRPSSPFRPPPARARRLGAQPCRRCRTTASLGSSARTSFKSASFAILNSRSGCRLRSPPRPASTRCPTASRLFLATLQSARRGDCARRDGRIWRHLERSLVYGGDTEAPTR